MKTLTLRINDNVKIEITEEYLGVVFKKQEIVDEQIHKKRVSENKINKKSNNKKKFKSKSEETICETHNGLEKRLYCALK